MEENTIHIHNGTTLAHSHQFGKFEEDFIRHIEDAKEKMRQANKQWSEVFGPLLSNIPNGVGKKQICSFCQFSSSTYDRLRKRLPSVKSGNADILNLLLVGGRYENESQVEYIFTRYVHSRNPIEEGTLDDMVYQFVAKTYDYNKDLVPLLANGDTSPFFAFKHLAESFILQRSEKPLAFIRSLINNGNLKLNAIVGKDILSLPSFDKYGIPLKDDSGKLVKVKHSVIRGSKTVQRYSNEPAFLYVSFLNHIDEQISRVSRTLSRNLQEIMDDHLDMLYDKKKRRITLNNIPLPKKTLTTKYSRYINNPAIDPFTRDNIITLGVHLAMTFEQIDHLLEVLHMDQLVYKTYSDCMLLYILGQLERNEILDIDMSYSDIEKIANDHFLVYLFENDYESVKDEVMKYFEGYRDNAPI